MVVPPFPRRPPRGGLGEGKTSLPTGERRARGSFIFIFCCILFFLHPLRGNRVCALQQRPRDLRPLSLALQSAATAFSVSIALSSSSRRELPSPSVTWWGQRGGSPAENLSVQHFPNTPAALLLSLPSAKCIYFKVLSSRFIFFFFFHFLRSPPHDAIVAIVVVMPGAAGGNQPEQKKKKKIGQSQFSERIRRRRSRRRARGPEGPSQRPRAARCSETVARVSRSFYLFASFLKSRFPFLTLEGIRKSSVSVIEESYDSLGRPEP